MNNYMAVYVALFLDKSGSVRETGAYVGIAIEEVVIKAAQYAADRQYSFEIWQDDTRLHKADAGTPSAKSPT